MANSLRKGILSVLIANIINLGFNLLANFLLPMYLSVDTYAQLKTFQLYAMYAGLLHLGYVDGLYLKYGGKCIDEINKNELEDNLSTLRIFQAIITAGAIAFGIVLKNPILTAFGLSILPANMMSCFKNMYQAVGEFSLYSRIINGTTISYFILNMSFIFLAHSDNPYLYISIYIVVDVLLWVILEYKLHKENSFSIRLKFSKERLVDNIKTGILLTFGNLSSIFLTGMDRWFIKFLMNNIAFAQYSFAVSMENFMNVAISPLSVTLYNYFCKEKNENKIRQVRNSVQIFAAFIISCAFPAKFILEHYLSKYLEATSVMFFLFGAQLFYIVIKCIYVNLYKADLRQKQYFIRIIVVIILGMLLNVCFYLLLHTKEAFAIGTLLSAVIWWTLCAYDNKKIRYSFNEIIYMVLTEISYLVCGNFMGSITGLLCYVAVITMLSFILLKKDFLFFIKNAKAMIISKTNTTGGN